MSVIPATRKSYASAPFPEDYWEARHFPVLKITGEMCVEKEDRVNRWHLIEHSGGRFVRSILLPEDSKPQEVEARMEDGVLSIQVQRIENKNGTAHIAIR